MKKLKLLFLALTSVIICNAQNPQWINYTLENTGLSSNMINAVLIDVSGSKWIGTTSGLAKLDSTVWTIFNTDNSGLPDNNVISIAIDGSGNKWIGTYGGGLAVFLANDTSQLQEPNINTSLIVYPNPVKDRLKIESDRDYEIKYKLININGQLIKSGSFKANKILNTSDLRSSIYILKLFSKNEMKVFRIIKR